MNIIRKKDGRYATDPIIFKYMSNVNMSNSAIFVSSCYAFGENSSEKEMFDVDYKTADILLGLGADVVFGYNDRVLQEYDFATAYEMYKGLACGYTIQEALDEAVKKNGASDFIWFRKTGGTEEDLNTIKERGDNESFPFIRGNTSFMLYNELENGGFEGKTLSRYWRTYGDVRRRGNLAFVIPKEGTHMAMISMGIGSGENGYMQQVESRISQRIYIDETVKWLEFDYNFVSEEPMEYVGNIYDDKFIIKVLNLDQTVVDAYEIASVNKSRWVSCPSVNFPGGDNTTYQTGWEHYSIDVSQYQGTRKEFSFVVYDVGDSQYDSVALIDNIVLR